MDFRLTDEQVLIRNTVRQFAEKEIAPRAEEIDATDEFPADIFRRMAELGLLGIPFCEAYGGAGGDYLSLLLALEEVARFPARWPSSSMPIPRCAASRSTCSARGAKAKIPASAGARAKRSAAFGLTEPVRVPTPGPPAPAPSATADQWVINGQKQFITNGSLADVVVVAAKTDADKGTRGSLRSLSKKGRRASFRDATKRRWG